MGKLALQNTPGFNAGLSYAKSMRVSDIIIDPEIASIFKMQENIRHGIFLKIKKSGFDKSQPLTIQKGTNILLDGHTRLSAAKEAGLEEVPVVEMEFDDRGAAMMYTVERQAIRRNLTSSEILRVVELLPETRNKKGEGSAAEQLAETLGYSPSTIYQAKKVSKEAPPEVLAAVKNGEMSIKAGYQETVKPKTENQSEKKPATKKIKAVEKIAELNNNVKTAHSKIGVALNYINDNKVFNLLDEAMNCLKTVENGLAVLE